MDRRCLHCSIGKVLETCFLMPESLSLSRSPFLADPATWAGTVDGKPVFGFDAEWKPSFSPGKVNKVALVQLCHGDECLLLHIKFMRGPPPALVEFLESNMYVKVGVGIRGDLVNLKRDYGIEMNGVIDLSDYANFRLGGEMTRSLASLTKLVQGQVLNKPKKITMSNWELRLSDRQVDYAANDVASSYDIFFGLDTMAEAAATRGARMPNMVFTFALSQEIKDKKATKRRRLTRGELTDQDVDIHSLFQQGKSIREISALVGIELNRVESILVNVGQLSFFFFC